MFKHKHRGGMHRHFAHPDHPFCDMRGGFARHGGERRGGRLFDYGELRLLVLALIAQAPAHGYELIKTIEDRFGGAYSPSPGVIYPTLSWLEDSGFASVVPEGGRKNYAITEEGRAFLAANQAAADSLFQRAGGPSGRRGRSLEIMRSMHNLKTALRLRLAAGPLEEGSVEAIAKAIDEAAQKIAKI